MISPSHYRRLTMFRKVMVMFVALTILVSASLATVYAEGPPSVDPEGPIISRPQQIMVG